MKRLKAFMKMVSPYATVGTLCIVSDVIFDFGLVTIPQPFALCLFASRYIAVASYSVMKIFLRHKAHNDVQNAFQSSREISRPEIGVVLTHPDYRGGEQR